MNINTAFTLLSLTGSCTQADIKKAYKSASIRFHPDKNPGGTEMMKAINEAYSFLQGQGEPVEPNQYFQESNHSTEMMAALNQLATLEGIEIEICGSFIWVSGNTKPHSKVLGRNGIGCYWASKKKMWFFRPADYKSQGRGNMSMDDIREKHGSEKPRSNAQPKRIAA